MNRTHPSFRSPRGPQAAACATLSLLLLAGCASTEVGPQWTDPQFQGRSLRGKTLLVVCEASDPTTKRLCQDQLAAQATAYGATPRIPASEPANPTPGREQNPQAYLPAARSAGAEAVLSAAVVSEPVGTVRSGPSVGIGVGGYGGGRVGGGIGISLPIFGSRDRVETALGLNGALTDVASGRLMWSARATAPGGEVNKQLDELARSTLEAASKAGFF